MTSGGGGRRREENEPARRRGVEGRSKSIYSIPTIHLIVLLV